VEWYYSIPIPSDECTLLALKWLCPCGENESRQQHHIRTDLNRGSGGSTDGWRNLTKDILQSKILRGSRAE
jgi:hypothetical protein